MDLYVELNEKLTKSGQSNSISKRHRWLLVEGDSYKTGEDSPFFNI